MAFDNFTYFHQVVQDKPFGWDYTNPPRTGYFWFEPVDHNNWPGYIERNQWWAYAAGAVYILTIFGLQHWMRNRSAYSLKTSLFLWNAGLGIFSILGFVRTLPGLIHVMGVENGFYKSVCSKVEMDVATAFWILLFTFSKYVELGDTVFIVLRKRPLIFLQWYHHLVTMSVVWIVAPLVEPIARWYMVLNYGVHSLMYPYFAARAVGIKVPTTFANFITTLQLTQMIVGLGVNLSSLAYQKMGYECARYQISIQAFSVVYGSFLLLFGKLFYDSVIKAGRKQKEAKERKAVHSKKID